MLETLKTQTSLFNLGRHKIYTSESCYKHLPCVGFEFKEL